jgi:putative ABC transport system permease protein
MREARVRRVLRALLALYPAAFRLSLGDDLVETALHRWRDLRVRARWTGALRFWLMEGIRFALDGVLERLRCVPPLAGEAGRAWRQVWRAPGHHAVAVGTLALGIAATTTIFTVTDAVVFRPLPYAGGDELYLIHARFGGLELSGNSLLNLRDLQASVTTLSWLAGAEDRSPSLTDASGDAERVAALFVTEGYLPGLGARVSAGRAFVAADFAAGAERVALVSDALAQRRWGAAAAIGRSVSIDGVTHTVIGVIHPTFRDPEPIESGAITDVWLPARAGSRKDRADFGFRLLGRLRTGTSLASAGRELSALGARLTSAYPEANRMRDDGLDFVLHPLRDLTLGDARARLLLLLGAVVLLLVLSCANVANLFLARGVTRTSELAVRSALGATRTRLAVQLFGESLLTAVIAGAVGGALGALGLRVFLAFAPAGLPRLHEVGLHLQALGFVILLTVLTAVVFGSVPALRASRAAVSSSMRTTASQHTQRLQSALVALEVAVALVLLTGSALLLNSLRHTLRVDPGFDAADVIVVDVRPPITAGSHAEDVQFYRTLLERARGVPGVAQAALIHAVPGNSGGAWSRVTPDVAAGREPATVPSRAAAYGDRPGDELFRFNAVHGRFAEALDIPLLAGRLFDDEPGTGAVLSVVVNEAAARRFFPDVDLPLGRRLMLGEAGSRAPLREVIGVVADVRQRGTREAAEPQIYVPYSQRDVNRMSLVLELQPGAVLAPETMRAVVRDVAPGLPIDRMEPLAIRYAETGEQSRFLTFLLSVFAAIGLLLAVVGTYATTAHALSRRIRELGIRIALGASTRAVFRLVLSRALLTASAGIMAGLLLALPLTRFLDSYIYGITARDPATVAAAALLIGISATLASIGPAIRAARVDPNNVLRID